MSNPILKYAVLFASALLACRAAADVVFSEIMYHPGDAPDGTEEDQLEFIELFNNGAEPVTLTNAYFSRGITYTFSNTNPAVMNPGAFLVLVRDRAAFQSRYPGVTNLAEGVYTGRFDNDGERVTLRVGAATANFTYGTSNAWPVAADGFGPSLERICLTATGESSVNWAASGTPTNWLQVAWTGQFASASITAAFFLDDDGLCLLDDVSIKAVGSGDEAVANGAFESGLTGWSVTNSHAQSRVEAGLGSDGGAALAIQCNESRWYLDAPLFSRTFFGDAFSNRVVSAPIAVIPGQNYAVSWRARRVGLGGTLYGVIGGVTNALSFTHWGSPGRSNSVNAAFLPIGITNVVQTLTLCPVAATNVVRAKLSAPAEVASVVLSYQTVATNQYRFTNRSYSQLAMRDDGVAPDTAAGDGTYAVNLPPILSNLTLVRYHVIATATNGFGARSPHLDDPSTDHAYWVQSTSPQTNLPNWQLLMDGVPLQYPYSRHLCAVSPDGQVFTDIMAKHRGNAESEDLTHTGIGLHFHRSKKYNAWFAANQSGINIRHRLNNVKYYYRRVVAEPLAYDLQRLIGLPTPRLRHICAWINGFPTITTELESPETAFLTGNGISTADYVSRQSYGSGRETVGGTTNLDNFVGLQSGLTTLTGANRNAYVRTNLCHEVNQHCLALLSLTGNGDQDLDWNMMQHRSATDGRWRQYPWDVDISFDLSYTNAWTTLSELHPYYKTPLYPSIWDAGASGPLGLSLFYPEGLDASTLPYRHRHQMTLWRYCHTLFTTNILYPKLDQMLTTLTPAYRQIGSFYSSNSSLNALSNQANAVKTFIAKRRDSLMNGAWSDKMPEIWAPARVYQPTNVVISEIMHSPPAGGVYVELYNRGSDPADLSRWSLSASGYAGTLPFGTMIGPTSYLVLASSQQALTNTYVELGQPSGMVERYPTTRIWDGPIAFNTATEYASRVIELPTLSVSPYGATLELRDLFSNLIDTVTFSGFAPWPNSAGVALERIDPASPDTTYAAWRTSTVVGTPGILNTASDNADLDALSDIWEQRIIAASAGLYTQVSQIQANDDFDGDGLVNGVEFVLGTDPTVPDTWQAALQISLSGGAAYVGFPTIPAAGAGYAFYSGRFYTLLNTTSLTSAAWAPVPGYAGLAAGAPVVYTNAVPLPFEAFRFEAELRAIRP